MSGIPRILAIAGVGLLLNGCETIKSIYSSEDEESSPPSELTDSAPKIDYKPVLEVEGEPEGEVESLLEDSARLFVLQDEKPTSIQRLRRRAESDVERLQKVLRSQGYYKGTITYEIDEDAKPVVATLKVDPGPMFRLARYEIKYQGAANPHPEFPTGPDKEIIEIGSRARSVGILDAKADIVRTLGNFGHPLAKVVDQKVVADYADNTLSVALTVDPGPEATFGALSVKGLQTVERPLIDNFVPWEQGDLYDQSKVSSFERKLAGTGLFNAVSVRHDKSVGSDGRLPLTADIEEDKHRVIGGGVQYSTNTGPGANAHWRHRNLFGQGENVRVNLKVAQIEQLLGLTASKPAFLHPDQTLIAETSLQRDRNDAFDQDQLAASVGVERTFGDYISGRVGLSSEYSLITDELGENRVLLFGVPVTAKYDNSDNLLNPTKGFRVALTTTPFVGNDDDGELHFLRNQLTAATYFAIDRKADYVFAARARLGSIALAERNRVPANHRFYSGGGGSIRGFGYQLIGPLDGENDPIGGRSVMELTVETRIRVGEDWGIVPFLEAGSVSKDVYPNLSRRPRYSAGIGGRYYTSFGPLRVDVAFPLNPRNGIDDPFQFYVSLGQAF